MGNTFGELKPYLLRESTGDRSFRLVTPKHFYVSPFSPLDLTFDFKLRVPGEWLEIHIDDREGDCPVLLSALTGRRAPLTTAQLEYAADDVAYLNEIADRLSEHLRTLGREQWVIEDCRALDAS